MKLRWLIIGSICAGLVACKVCQSSTHKEYKNYSGQVTDVNVAINIAEANWCEKYGRKILRYKPFKAKKVQEVWIVYGSLKTGLYGGTPEIKIDELTGKVLEIYRTK
jgi:hypothetical protein